MPLKRMFFLYRRMYAGQLKAILEYKADVIILMISAALTQVLGLVFLWVIYDRIPDIQGWTFWEVVFMYAMIFLTEGIGSLFFEGTWRMGGLVNRGELDRYLLRPVPVVLQIFCTGIGINGLGNLVIGGILVWQSLLHAGMIWTPGKLAVTLLLVLTAMAIRVAINFAGNSAAFWIKNAGNAFPLMVHSLSDLAKYPLTLFHTGIQVFISVVVPYAFISFFPATYVFGKTSWGGYWLLGPLVAVLFWLAAYRVFRIGLRQYESTGN
ncbi:ABC-2 family transporter protein [Paenibacillus sp. JX-17]|uniref:ABC-2 family transporter protein n=1 Tax=Paenibacillus lacisoli TaxID=3064525 RepID=A0ABT9C9H8_9BACL|nr:ABC-2 family transporter protein [Paenibacillus sp. JX-17]MDO7905912.1 ABC-2 family transporter protein [Paenibacillus sp. JX-17]